MLLSAVQGRREYPVSSDRCLRPRVLSRTCEYPVKPESDAEGLALRGALWRLAGDVTQCAGLTNVRPPSAITVNIAPARNARRGFSRWRLGVDPTPSRSPSRSPQARWPSRSSGGAPWRSLRRCWLPSGSSALWSPPRQWPPAKTVRVAALSLRLPGEIDARWGRREVRSEDTWAVLTRLEGLARRVAADGARVVVWPEYGLFVSGGPGSHAGTGGGVVAGDRRGDRGRLDRRGGPARTERFSPPPTATLLTTSSSASSP